MTADLAEALSLIREVRTMTFNQLKIFEAVARRLSITEASRDLRISQPGVSRQLKLLQEGYGVKLYQKLGRGIELTEKGQELLRGAKSILIQFVKLEGKLKKDELDGRAETLKIGGSRSQAASFLPSLLAVFKKSHPQTQITLRSDSSRAIERLVLTSEVEIALVTNPRGSPRITVQPYSRQRVLAFASVAHPSAKRTKMTPEEFAHAPLILLGAGKGEGSVQKILNEMKGRGLKPNVVMRCESPEAVKMAVRGKLGLGILCEDIMASDIKRGDFKSILIPQLKMKVDTFILYHNDRPLSPAAKDFLTLLREQLKNSSTKNRLARKSLRPYSINFVAPSMS